MSGVRAGSVAPWYRGYDIEIFARGSFLADTLIWRVSKNVNQGLDLRVKSAPQNFGVSL